VAGLAGPTARRVGRAPPRVRSNGGHSTQAVAGLRLLRMQATPRAARGWEANGPDGGGAGSRRVRKWRLGLRVEEGKGVEVI